MAGTITTIGLLALAFLVVLFTFTIRLKRPKLIFLVHLSVIVFYNVIGWGYLFTYLDAGGASLGPGLYLLAASGLHFAFAGICYLIFLVRLAGDVDTAVNK
ncbi:hypothetical protein D0C36_22275 [Mucilaginibacter conchicola]|uniref:Uncharacterized protein n=1 Tax=Mucilaginibacter conchicola TaxID=2303333 RepID=A0A372NNJ0_9SPHI|nr:hypothetical protein [Mucilaginibacter conchicola]RFZ90509.1 hypothetical protein D0C36_22275 [Mucilaginibacter conchicola]